MSKKVYRVRAGYLDDSGRGIVSFNRSLIPVPGLLPGELAEVEWYRKKDETLGRIVSLVEKSDQRQEDVCPYAGQCGGCQLWHMNYDAQLAFKQSQVETLMGAFGHVPEILGMQVPLCYRHKIHATLGRDRKGRVISGIYAQGTHKLNAIPECRIQDRVADEIMTTIRSGMKKLDIAPYDEDRQRGMLRHVLIKTGMVTGEIMIVFVVASLNFIQGKALSQMLIKKYPQIRTIVYNLNAQKTSMVLGDVQKIVYGDGYIEDELCGLRFQISPKSFYQINPSQAQVLYTKALEMAEITDKDVVLDAYCGTGTITLLAARCARQVTGVELNADAVADAKNNARINHIKNVNFVQQDAGAFMQAAADQKNKKAVDPAKIPHYNVVIMDPPRSGSTPVFLKALVHMEPERIVYISCNPVTQRRDMETLLKHGYGVKAIQPVDMFPHTAGIENIVVFEKSRQL